MNEDCIRDTLDFIESNIAIESAKQTVIITMTQKE